MAKKFNAPSANPYENLIQNVKTPAEPEEKEKDYRFCIRMPAYFKDYLQEIAWRNRTSITEYIQRLIMADMEKNPDWRDTLDILNK